MRFFGLVILLIISFSSYAGELFYSSFDGPNCINAAMVKSNLLPFHRYSSNQELWDKLHSIQCKNVTKEGHIKGDIGIVVDHGAHAIANIISHAFVYLDESRSYEKHGWAKSEAYQTVDTQSIFDEYGVSEENRVGVEYFRCISQKKFIAINSSMISNNLINLYNRILKLEILHHQIAQNITDDKASFIARYNSLKKDIFSLKMDNLSSLDLLFLQDLKNCLESIGASRLIEFKSAQN